MSRSSAMENSDLPDDVDSLQEEVTRLRHRAAQLEEWFHGFVKSGHHPHTGKRVHGTADQSDELLAVERRYRVIYAQKLQLERLVEVLNTAVRARRDLVVDVQEFLRNTESESRLDKDSASHVERIRSRLREYQMSLNRSVTLPYIGPERALDQTAVDSILTIRDVVQWPPSDTWQRTIDKYLNVQFLQELEEKLHSLYSVLLSRSKSGDIDERLRMRILDSLDAISDLNLICPAPVKRVPRRPSRSQKAGAAMDQKLNESIRTESGMSVSSLQEPENDSGLHPSKLPTLEMVMKRLPAAVRGRRETRDCMRDLLRDLKGRVRRVQLEKEVVQNRHDALDELHKGLADAVHESLELAATEAEQVSHVSQQRNVNERELLNGRKAVSVLADVCDTFRNFDENPSEVQLRSLLGYLKAMHSDSEVQDLISSSTRMDVTDTDDIGGNPSSAEEISNSLSQVRVREETLRTIHRNLVDLEHSIMQQRDRVEGELAARIEAIDSKLVSSQRDPG